MKIIIEGATVEDLAQSLSDMLFRRRWSDENEDAEETLERKVEAIVERRQRGLIEPAVEAAIESYTAAKAREIVDEIIATGVPRTDSYGRVQQDQTWRDFVINLLVRDQYDNGKLAKIAKQAVEELFKGQLKGLIDEVATKVRDQVDEMLGIKIKEAVRAAAGIKS